VLTASAIMSSKADECCKRERKTSNWLSRGPRISGFAMVHVFKAAKIASKSSRVAGLRGLLASSRTAPKSEKRSSGSRNLSQGRAKVDWNKFGKR
jgi:hypothetical protein